MSAPPMRRGAPRDYYEPMADPYDGRRHYERPRSPPVRSSRNKYDDPTPRRHKSERRRPPTPERPVEVDSDRSHRRKHRSDRHEKPAPRVVQTRPASSSLDRKYRRGASPPPPESHGRHDRGREHKSRRGERNSMPPPAHSRDYPPPAYEAAVAGGRKYPPTKAYHDDYDPRSQNRRSRRMSPEPSPRSRERGMREPRSSRAETIPAAPRHADPAGRPRPRSQARGGRGLTRSPPPPRNRSPPVSGARSKSVPKASIKPARRNSVPAKMMQQGASWWQNPMIQAGARNAFTAGAQAAMRSKGETGPWLGPKGAKVATAALGAALVDGILNQKHPDSKRVNIAHEGYEAAVEHMDKIPLPSRRSRR